MHYIEHLHQHAGNPLIYILELIFLIRRRVRHLKKSTVLIIKIWRE
jgi:hypothetical protein